MTTGIPQRIVPEAAWPGAAPPAVPRPRDHRLEVVGRTADFRRLRAEWNDLLRRSHSDCFFLTWEWLYPWWKHLGDAELSIVTVREAGRLIGVAPFMLVSSIVPSLELLGIGTVGSDYLDLIVDRDHEATVLATLRGWLKEQGATLTARQVRRSGSLMERLLARLARHEWTRTVRVTNVCPYADVAGASWESYLAGLSSSHRYNFRRRLRQLEEGFDVELEAVDSHPRRQRALQTLIDLHLGRWEGRGGSDAFSGPALTAFHEEASARALDAGWLRLYLLKLDGHPAAALYGFHYGDRFLFYQSGFDEAYGKHSVGLVLMGLTIRNAIDEGAREYDLLHGDERYKFSWAAKRREIARFDAYPPGLMGTMVRRGRDLTRASKRAARSLLPPAVLAGLGAAWSASS